MSSGTWSPSAVQMHSSAGNRYERIDIGGQSRTHLGDNYVNTIHYHQINARNDDFILDDNDNNDVGYDSEEEEANRKQKAILAHLWHPDIERRPMTISDLDLSAHEWAFHPSHSSLTPWLEHEGGIFWVTGKAGSGKSTFMKFLARHPKIGNHLNAWAAHRRLVVAEHYFWYASTGILQSSFEGLMRGVLYAALCEVPEAIATVFPTRWARDEEPSRSSWTEAELLAALNGLGTLQDVCFALFLDGLDECIPSRDHGTLVRDLESLAENANMKLCVSSRPWQIFATHFGGSFYRLDLHTLTSTDMTSHIWTELCKAERDANLFTAFCDRHADAKKLINDMTTKAEGVFLWTVLVLRSLREDIEAGQSMRDLQLCVDEMPTDLKDFFQTMIFERIDHRDTSAVARLLKCASLLAADGISAKSLAPEHNGSSGYMSFLNFEFLKDGRNANREDFASQLRHRKLSYTDLGKLLQQTRKYLGRLSRDLLHIPERPLEVASWEIERWCSNWVDIARTEVHFLHRTVLDYLLDPETQSLLDDHIPLHFQRSDFIARIILSRLRIFPDIPGAGVPFDTTDLDEYLCDTAILILSSQCPGNGDISCLRVDLLHLDVDLMAQYDEVALQWVAMAGRLDGWTYTPHNGMLCRLLTSFGHLQYTSQCLARVRRHHVQADSNYQLLMQDAISCLFFEPTAPYQALKLATLLGCDKLHDPKLTHVDEARLQSCPPWWSLLLSLWWKLQCEGSLKTPAGTLDYDSDMLKKLAKHIEIIARTLCTQGFDVFEDPTVWLAKRAQTLGSTSNNIKCETARDSREQSGTIFASLLNDSEKEQGMREILASVDRYVAPSPGQEVHDLSKEPLWYMDSSRSAIEWLSGGAEPPTNMAVREGREIPGESIASLLSELEEMRDLQDIVGVTEDGMS